MSFLSRISQSIIKKSILLCSVRPISTTRQLNIKELREYKQGTSLVVEGVKIPSPRSEYLVRAENVTEIAHDSQNCNVCYMCALNLDVKHTDVLILSQFVRSDGCMLPRRITKLCRRQQRKIGKMVTMAQKAGLMINLTPSYCKKDPKKRFGHKKFNTYFDEATIFMRYIPKPTDKFKR